MEVGPRISGLTFCVYSEVELPEKTAEVGSMTNPKVPPPNLTFAANESEIQTAGVTTNSGMFIPPNMSSIFYKESYEEFIREKMPMELRSMCWTPRQNLYVGCAGGQLLSVEFDSGSVSVLVNPYPAMDVRTANSKLPDSGLSGP